MQDRGEGTDQTFPGPGLQKYLSVSRFADGLQVQDAQVHQIQFNLPIGQHSTINFLQNLIRSDKQFLFFSPVLVSPPPPGS